MTTFIVDAQTSHTPIGEFFQTAADGVTEIRDQSGRLLATVIVQSDESEEDALYEKLHELAERDREIIERRLKTPIEQCFTTAELHQRLQQLDAGA